MKHTTTLTTQHHNLNNGQFSAGVLDITLTLQKNNFEAYIVGGAVRDLLLGITPKDFDVATNATPEQVNKIFRRSRIIGRRFKIVHVHSHYETIEVTTFRGSHNAKQLKNSKNNQGLLLSDNNYGTLEEDAQRRDFSINALYYDPGKQTISDFCHSLEAIASRELRVIGDPEIRFREDPVRMLRALRLQAKLPLSIAHDVEHVIVQQRALLRQVSTARLFDEMLKLFMNGNAFNSFNNLHRFSFLEELLPCTARYYPHNPAISELYKQALLNSDQRINQGKSITPSFLFAVFLWPEVQNKVQHLSAKNSQLTTQEIWLHAMQNTIEEQNSITSIAKRFQSMMREIWQLQHRLLNNINNDNRAKSTLAHPRFRAAYDFLVIREQTGEVEKGASMWWQQFQIQHADILEHSKNARDKLYQSKTHKKKPRR